MTEAATASLPLRIPADGQFQRARDFLARTGYSEAGVLSALSLESMSDIRLVRWEDFRPGDAPPAFRMCLELFLRGASLPLQDVQERFGGDVLNAFFELGLLRPARHAPGQVVSPVWLYPVQSFWVASDRPSDPDGQQFVPAEDVVFPAIYGGTLRFLKLLPDATGQDALDLCGGTGIGALQLSRTASAAFTSDITGRSAWYAAFNARLNGAAVTSLCGDVYAPAAGRTFGVITAHPPFVPAFGQNMVYRDGGESGEDITRRVIEGLPEFLRPGGACAVLCVARDTTTTPFEQRAAGWLGPAAGEFDVLFGLEKILSVEEVIESMRKRGQNFGPDHAAELMMRLRSSQTRQFVYGALHLRRADGWRPPPPCRLRLSSDGTAADFERVHEWRRRCGQPGFHEFLAAARPRLPARLVLTARHVVDQGQLVPAEFVFSIQAGLEAALKPDPWVVPILARLQGRRTLREIFEEAAAADDLPAGFGLEQFAGLVSLMIERGLLEVDRDQAPPGLSRTAAAPPAPKETI